jgi:hypothetical protein
MMAATVKAHQALSIGDAQHNIRGRAGPEQFDGTRVSPERPTDRREE